MVNPREHIEEIRRVKFSIGGNANPLTEDLHHAVKHLSAELYTKDVHFLMELIQNAEDNEYPADVEPSLEFVITTRDITGVGAPATLLLFNNEKGFSSSNIESLCSVGRSTKKVKKQGGYIGEKGIGFKSVFLVTSQPYIFSNGYQIKFNEIPPAGIKVGYIVPEWVHDKPNIEDLRNMYMYGDKCLAEFPNTCIILPLRPEKVEAVKEQLANIHPEVILFMSKIKKLCVRKDSQSNHPRINSVSVSQEIAFWTTKNEDSESFILHLSVEEKKESKGECSYYMWRQRFPVNAECKVEGRENIDNWVITLAFPREERVSISNRLGADIYAFLPTEMVTGLPFIIQADFLLVSSRESIIWDNEWNKGILECIPSAFCAAFLFLVKSVESAPPLSRSYCFRYLPIDLPSYPQLRQIQGKIKSMLETEEVMLCELEQGYCMPIEARKIHPSFRNILQKATDEGLEKPSGLRSTGAFIIHSCIDNSRSLDFFGIYDVHDEWYSICIQSIPGWLASFSEDLYVQFLCFLSQHWTYGIPSSLKRYPMFKYVDYPSGVSWASIDISSDGSRIYFFPEEEDIEWFARWNKVLGDAARYKFMPNATQSAMNKLDNYERLNLQGWLKRNPKITELTVSSFSKQLLEEVKASRSKKFVIHAAQFLHFSEKNNYISSEEMLNLCSRLPVVDESGTVVSNREAKILPASIGKWAKVMGDNPWAAYRIVTLSSDYMRLPPCARGLAGEGEDELKLFVRNGLGATDIPNLRPPNAELPLNSFSISKENGFLLLEWIHHLTVNSNVSLPVKFARSIIETKWLKTHKGYQSPDMSFLFNSEWESADLQLNDLSFIDTSFYGRPMDKFKETLEQIGVVLDFGEGCEVVAKHLEMHTEFNAITRLYKYLHRFGWKPREMSSIKIWIPFDGGHAGEWKDARMCVVHDDDGLFLGRREILANIYEATLLPFFSSRLGVPLHPRIGDYCNLWLDWVSHNHPLTGTECCLVWGNILKHLSPYSTIKIYFRTQGLKLPVYTNDGHIQLSAPNETFVPDDLSLKKLFKNASNRIKFVWHPNPSDPNIPLDLLFTMYNSVGVQNISQAIQKKEVSVSSDISLRRLQAGKGLFRIGLYKIVLGYLAYPSFKISVDKRHQIVRTLLQSSVFEMTQPLRVAYTLTVMTGNGEAENIEAIASSLVRWEKDKRRILLLKSAPHNRKAKASLAGEFADVVSKGLLSEHPDLVPALCDMLKMGCILGFDNDEVNDMLLDKNLQLFKEDENFLSQFFPETNEQSVWFNPPRTYDRGSNDWGSSKGSGTQGEPVNSPRQSVDGRRGGVYLNKQWRI